MFAVNLVQLLENTGNYSAMQRILTLYNMSERFVIVFFKLDDFSYYIRLFKYICYFRKIVISRIK